MEVRYATDSPGNNARFSYSTSAGIPHIRRVPVGPEHRHDLENITAESGVDVPWPRGGAPTPRKQHSDF